MCLSLDVCAREYHPVYMDECRSQYLDGSQDTTRRSVFYPSTLEDATSLSAPLFPHITKKGSVTCEQEPIPGAVHFAGKYTVGLCGGWCLLFSTSLENTFCPSTSTKLCSPCSPTLSLLMCRTISQDNADCCQDCVQGHVLSV